MSLNIKHINFVLMNRLVSLAVLLALLMFCLRLYQDNLKVKARLRFIKPQSSSLSLQKKDIKSLFYYEAEISRRNIFGAGVNEQVLAKPAAAGPIFKEMIKDLHVSGILWGNKKQVVIEDAKLNKVYFLSAGDYLGEVKITEIYSDRVSLEFQGEKIDLFL